MKLSNISYWTVCLLGSVDGLIVGLITESLYKFYYHWEWRRAAEYHHQLGLGGDVERGPLSLHNHFAIPFLCVAAFALAACLLRRVLLERRVSVIIFWQLIAISGVTMAFLVYFYESLYIDLKFLAQPSARYGLLGAFWTWLACALIACLIGLVYGAIVQKLNRRDFGSGVASDH